MGRHEPVCFGHRETSGCGIGLEQKPGADDVVVVILKGTEGQIDRAQLLLQLR